MKMGKRDRTTRPVKFEEKGNQMGKEREEKL